MYESEVNRLTEPIETLPPDIVRRFTEGIDDILQRTLLPWGEHCTECNFPVCYTTCELYTPRADGACRLFMDGSVRINFRGGLNPYLLKIRFKRWGKLWTVGNLALRTVKDAGKMEKANLAAGTFARSLPLPAPVRKRVLGKVGYMRRRNAEEAMPSVESPDYFLIECYNPNPRAITLTLSIRLRQGARARPFQTAVELQPGFTRAKISFADIARVVDLRQRFEVEIVPNDCGGTVLYFGLMDFVKLNGAAQKTGSPATTGPSGERRWKCIVWDLDNTLWDGVLIEDGPDKIRLRQDVVDVIKETDRRGILHSIASKNNEEDAMEVLRKCGIDEYFLHPQIHWQPKSQSIAAIAQSLNIGVDSMAFIDDQPFEREEVKSALPAVTTLDASDVGSLAGRAECFSPVTEEGCQRRLMYRQQEQRKSALDSFGGDYLSFLKECNIRLNVARLNRDNLERVYELAQRTNQMNFSGNRYHRAELETLMQSAHHESLVLTCTDRFGSYGIVGFAVVDAREPRLLDLMFSCRVQGKRVEHAFLGFLLEKFVAERTRDFYVNYQKTSKNQAAGKVFDDLGFESTGENDGTLSLAFRKERPLPREAIIQISTMAEQPA